MLDEDCLEGVAAIRDLQLREPNCHERMSVVEDANELLASSDNQLADLLPFLARPHEGKLFKRQVKQWVDWQERVQDILSVDF